MSIKNQGMNWITQHKRLAIYLRDGLACAYCGESVEDGAGLTLDHVLAVIAGGTNHEANLVTACMRCNSSKNDRPSATFAKAVAAYINHGLEAKQITAHVATCVARSLKPYLVEAKRLIAERGSASRVIAHLKH